MRDHGAPWGRSLIMASSFATLVCLGVPAGMLASNHVMPIWAMMLPVAVLVVAAFYVVRGYRVRDGTLWVRRLVWSTPLPLGDLRSAGFEPLAMRGSVRMFGNGGLYSYSGHFRNPALGRYRAFVTDTQRTVVLRFASGTVVVSPEDPEALLADIDAGRPAVAAAPPPAWPPSPA